MSGLLDLINSPIGKQLISGVAGQTGQPENKTADVLAMAMPLLMGAMKKNASTPGGAQGLMSALSSKHDGGILDNLGGLFGGGVDQSVMDDGAGILGHVFGSKQPQVENALSSKSGIDAGSVTQILEWTWRTFRRIVRKIKVNTLYLTSRLESLNGFFYILTT